MQFFRRQVPLPIPSALENTQQLSRASRQKTEIYWVRPSLKVEQIGILMNETIVFNED